ncbi:unnamed protein product, partial [Urochloa humidicola]
MDGGVELLQGLLIRTQRPRSGQQGHWIIYVGMKSTSDGVAVDGHCSEEHCSEYLYGEPATSTVEAKHLCEGAGCFKNRIAVVPVALKIFFSFDVPLHKWLGREVDWRKACYTCVDAKHVDLISLHIVVC